MVFTREENFGKPKVKREKMAEVEVQLFGGVVIIGAGVGFKKRVDSSSKEGRLNGG